MDAPLANIVRARLLEKERRRDACPAGFDALATLTWKSPLKRKSIAGFLQVLSPSHMKLGALNPLGQPLVVLATDGRSFQMIDTLKREFFLGYLAVLARRLYFSPALLLGGWGDRLYGIPPTLTETSKILAADSPREFWIMTPLRDGELKAKEYALLSTESLQVRIRIITDNDERIIARIEYDDRQRQGICAQPTKLRITGLVRGAEINIALRDILAENAFTAEDFTLRRPR